MASYNDNYKDAVRLDDTRFRVSAIYDGDVVNRGQWAPYSVPPDMIRTCTEGPGGKVLITFRVPHGLAVGNSLVLSGTFGPVAYHGVVSCTRHPSGKVQVRFESPHGMAVGNGLVLKGTVG